MQVTETGRQSLQSMIQLLQNPKAVLEPETVSSVRTRLARTWGRGLLLDLGLGGAAQLLLELDGEDGAVGLRALVQLLQQLAALPEVRQLLVEGGAAAAAAAVCVVVVDCAAVVVVVAGLLGQLGGVVDVEALALEELDDGEFGQVQLGGQRVHGLLVGVQPHVLDEALQDPQSLQGDLAPAGARLDAAPSAALVLRLGGGGRGGLAGRQAGARGGLLLL